MAVTNRQVHRLLATAALVCASVSASTHDEEGQSPPSCGAAGLANSDLVECSDDIELAPVQLLQQDLHLTKGLSLEQTAQAEFEIKPDGKVADVSKILPPKVAANKTLYLGKLLDGELLLDTTTTTPPPTGLSLNAVGDMKAFFSSLVLYYGACLACIAGFSIVRLWYPIVYSNNALEGIVPTPENFDTKIGWIWPTMRLTTDEIASHITLDHAMLIEYSTYGLRVFTIIGAPMIILEGAANWAFGGTAAGEDHLSYLSFGNVKNGSWLYWVHCFVVWLVVIYTTHSLHQAMRNFLPRRFKWLREMSAICANTVLVDGVPEEYRSVDKLKGTLQELIPGCSLQVVDFVKDTSVLETLINQKENAQYYLQVAEAQKQKDPAAVPMVRESTIGSKVEAIPYWKNNISELEPKIRDERRRIEAEAKGTGGVNLSNAFVQFSNRTHAELAISLSGRVTFDSDEWAILHAPEPSDILWADLTQDDTARQVRGVIGYLLVIALAFAYLPLVLLVTNLGKLIDLSKIGLGILQSVWDGVAPTLGLQFMVAFLPTFLILIFKAFFTLRAEALQQHKLQIWYFWFQFIFVLLATAVGQNFMDFAKTVISDPMSIIPVLADTMPYATHYYMNFLVLQAMSHGMNCTRYIPFMKYRAALTVWEEKDAKALAEPEDQDYYGMGSRSARWTIMFGVGLVFGTLCPPINFLVGINFVVCRVIYGYLVFYAETPKADTGGKFFVTSLEQTFPLLFLYVLLMSGVLYRRSSSLGPCIISAVSLIWIAFSLNKFKHITWEDLPAMELQADKDTKRRQTKGDYVQPELKEK